MPHKKVVLSLLSALLIFCAAGTAAAFLLPARGSGTRLGRMLGKQAAAVALASSTQAASLPAEISHGDQSKNQVIFTFDGGAGADSGDAILAALAKHHAKGTFFLTGKMIEAHPDLVRKIVAGGHEIFSHTYDHPKLPTLADAQITDELAKMESALQAVAGISPKPYFRAPYGARDPRVLGVAAQSGYQSVYWTVDALDWKQKQGQTADQVRQRILESVAPGAIYLMHVGDSITGAILDDAFSAIEAKGYKIVSLTQGL